MVLQKVGAWGLRPRQVGVKGGRRLGRWDPKPSACPAGAGIREVGQALATAEWLATEVGKHLATAPEPDREA